MAQQDAADDGEGFNMVAVDDVAMAGDTVQRHVWPLPVC